MEKRIFGKTTDGKEIWLYTLSNSQNMVVQVINYGGIITSIQVPDKNGVNKDVVLGFDNLKAYLGDHPHFGALVGPYANRIGKGKFALDGVEYQLTLNEHKNHLHGGEAAFSKVVWESEEFSNSDVVGVRLFHLCPDGRGGYPGNLETIAKYSLNEENELSIEYEARTDQPTVVNLTNHSYFNLGGEGSGNIFGQEVMINADAYTPVNSELIPTGEISSVQGTPLDFRSAKPIGAQLEQLRGGGYDHNYVLNQNGPKPYLAAWAHDPGSGRVIEVFTTAPGLQFYTSNAFTGNLRGKSGRLYPKHSAFCLETQHFPDSPNQASFPNVRLNPQEVYKQQTIYKFTVKK